MQTYNGNPFPDFVKLIGYLTFVIIVVLSKASFGLSPRAKISFFLLWTCREELTSAPK